MSADQMSPAQADGLARIHCGASLDDSRVRSVPVGRSTTRSQVFACLTCAAGWSS